MYNQKNVLKLLITVIALALMFGVILVTPMRLYLKKVKSIRKSWIS